MESAKELCPPIRRRTQPWISDECLDMIDEQKCVKLVDFERYCQLSNDVRCRMKEEREAYWLTWKKQPQSTSTTQFIERSDT